MPSLLCPTISITNHYIQTILLTAFSSLTLFILYRRALKPIIARYGVPLRDLSARLGRDGGYVRLGEEEERRRLEEGFRDESSDEEDGDLRRSTEVR
jgi:hypothetical protein